MPLRGSECNRGTGCGKTARPGLHGGRRATGVPTVAGQRRDKPAQWCRVQVPDSESRANHTGPESCAGVGHGVGEALTGEGTGRVGSPAIGLLLGADALRTRGRPPRRRREGEAATAPAESATSAWTATLRAEPGRPCLWPGERSPGPHGAPEGHDRDGRGQGVGPLQRTEEACAHGWPRGTGGAGGGQGAGQGARGGAHQEPDPAPGSPVPGARRRTAGTCGYLHVSPEAGARCGSAARRELCGGCRVTGIPTATVHW
jgi:hypothetical protein